MSRLTNILSVVLSGIALTVALFAYDRATDPARAIEALTLQNPPAANIAPDVTGNADELQDELAKVVYHVDYSDPKRFSAMVTSINNMTNTFQDEIIDYDIRIVFIANGIRFVTDDKLKGTPFAEDAALAERREELRGRLAALHDVQGVKLELCDITRKSIGLDKEKLYPGVDLVPSGVVRLAELQSQGFSYIKIK